MNRLSTFSLSVLNVILFSILIIVSCKKDPTTSTDASTLTVEEAKNFFNSKISNDPLDLISSRSGDNETLPSGPLVIADWANAVSYFDAMKQQSVVEVPLLKGNFSRYLLNPENDIVDTTTFIKSPKSNRLVIVRDLQGITDYAIMKISGTFHYNINSGAQAANSYETLDNSFKGFINYVDIYDQPKFSYYVSDGRYYKIDSITNGLNQNYTQDRWAVYCITTYEYVPCPCEGHQTGDHCTCSTPPRVIEHEVCYNLVLINGGNGNTGVPPIFPSVQWGTGGSPINSYNANCFIPQINAFDSIYGTDVMTDYEDLVYSCYGGCNAAYFDECLEGKILKAWTVEGPKHPITNLNQQLNCFNTSSNNDFTHKVTLHVDQPVTNEDDSFSVKESVGHTFLTIEQTDASGNSITLSVGFYPVISASPCDQIDGGAFNDDSGHSFDVAVSWELNPYAFNNLITSLRGDNNPPIYNLSSNNCTTWALKHLNHIGFQVPENETSSLMFPKFTQCKIKGLAPGQLGQDIRSSSY